MDASISQRVKLHDLPVGIDTTCLNKNPPILTNAIEVKLTGTAFAATSLFSNTVIITTRDAADFDWIYTQNVSSSCQDLELNSPTDFLLSTASERPVIFGLIASHTSEDFYRTDCGGCLSRPNFNTDTDAHTTRSRVQILSTAVPNGTLGNMAIFTSSSADASRIRYIDGTEIWVNNGGTIAVLRTLDNTDGFHTSRLAYDGAGEFTDWRYSAGVLIGKESSQAATSGGNGVFIGDTSGFGNNEDRNLDNMSITSGAVVPVPEPSSTVLFDFEGATLILLRRQQTQ